MARRRLGQRELEVGATEETVGPLAPGDERWEGDGRHKGSREGGGAELEVKGRGAAKVALHGEEALRVGPLEHAAHPHRRPGDNAERLHAHLAAAAALVRRAAAARQADAPRRTVAQRGAPERRAILALAILLRDARLPAPLPAMRAEQVPLGRSARRQLTDGPYAGNLKLSRREKPAAALGNARERARDGAVGGALHARIARAAPAAPRLGGA
eukprot:scaffold72347_cov16-Tisochrysis_lutea.AAC.2